MVLLAPERTFYSLVFTPDPSGVPVITSTTTESFQFTWSLHSPATALLAGLVVTSVPVFPAPFVSRQEESSPAVTLQIEREGEQKMLCRSWFPITVSLCHKLCMVYPSSLEILHQEVTTEPNQHSSSSCLGPGRRLKLHVLHAAGNSSGACARQLSPKGKRNKCFSSQTSRMSSFLGLDPGLICSSFGLCLSPWQPRLGPS